MSKISTILPHWLTVVNFLVNSIALELPEFEASASSRGKEEALATS